MAANMAFSRSRSYGRTVRRSGASLDGTLSNWVNRMISSRTGEREKDMLSGRALDLYTNDALGHALLEGALIETVGIGLSPIFTPRHVWLGRSQEWATEFESAARRIWSTWGLGVHLWADAQRRLNFYSLQALTYFQWKLYGIGIMQVVTRKDALRPLSVALLPICPTRLATPTNAKGDVYDGIEIDTYGAPVAAYIRKPESPMGGAVDCFDKVEIYDRETGLPKLLLTCGVRNVAEYRADSMYAPIVKTLRDANDFMDAVVVSALVRNLVVGFIQNATSSVGPDTPFQDRVHEIDKGTFIEGGKNEVPHFFNHPAAPPDLAVMNSAVLDRAGMATSRGAENVMRKFQASYSASKASFEKSSEVSEFEHIQLNTRFNQPALCWMLYEAVARSYLPVSDIRDFVSNMDSYCAVRWLPAPMRQIDREKAAKGDALRLSNGTTTLAQICGEQGKDWREEMEQRAKEKRMQQDLEKQYGISLSEAAPAVQEQPQDSENTDNKDSSDDEKQ